MRPPPSPGDALGPSRVVIGNVFSDYNRGGAALTAACIEAIRATFSDSEITAVAVPFPGRPLRESHALTMSSFPGIEVLPPPFPIGSGSKGAFRATVRSLAALLRRERGGESPALRRMAQANLIVSRGGYIFVERHGRAGLIALWHTAYPLIYGARKGVPTVVFSSSIGPFRTRGSRALNGWILRRATLVLARDAASYRRALEVGVLPERVREVPDSVLATTPPASEACEDVARRLGLAASSFGVVTVRALRRSGKAGGLIDRLAQSMRAVLEEGLVGRVVIVDHVAGGDADASNELRLAIGDDRAMLVHDQLNPSELIALYGAARFVVGCRLHSAVFGVVAGTPAIAVSLAEAKAEGIFDEIGLGRFVVREDFAPRELLELIRGVVAGGSAIREQVAEAASGARSRVARLPDLLRAAAAGLEVPPLAQDRAGTVARASDDESTASG